MSKCQSADEKILVLAKILRKERKKAKKFSKILEIEMEGHAKTKGLLGKEREEMIKLIEENKKKDERIIKSHSSYTELYD